MQKADYFGLVAGVNITDSPFFVKPTQATDNSVNYDFIRTGAVSKRRGHKSINTTADSQVVTHGIGLYHGDDGSKTVMRAGGTKFQTIDGNTGVSSNLHSDDATPITDFFSSLDTSKTLMQQFNNGQTGVVWALGGGQLVPYGYNGVVQQSQISTLTRVSEPWASLSTTNTVTLKINNRSYTQSFVTDNNTSLIALATLLSTDTDILMSQVTSTGADKSEITLTGKLGVPVQISEVVASPGGPSIFANTTQVAYSGPTVTKNGVPTPVGAFKGAAFASSITASFQFTGVYYFAMGLRKASTQAISNASLDFSVTITDTTQSVRVTFPAGIDTTKYDQIQLYSSALNGSNIFTTGNLVVQLASNTSSFIWNGLDTLAQTQLIPRPGSPVLDNSTLDYKKSFNGMTTWRNRLITAAKNTIYLSDLLKSESWPVNNNITITTGGDIKALSAIGFNTPTTSASDEKLCVWKNEEMWEVTGNDSADWVLKFVDVIGCPSQSLVARANGMVFWMNSRGIFMWSGSGKPVRISRPIEAMFSADGDLDKSKLSKGFAVYYKKQNQVIWVCSHKIYGENAFAIKLDLRLTMPFYKQEMLGNEIEGVFSFDSQPPVYAGMVYSPSASQDEIFLAGNNTGYTKKMYLSASDDGAGIPFSYSTPFLDMGAPSIAKRYKKIVVWIDQLITDKKLLLQYWSDYRTVAADMSQVSETLGTTDKTTPAIWDLGVWDESNWDDSTPTLHPVVFNLSSGEDNNEGDCIRLRIINNDADTPITVHGISIFWDQMSVRK